MKSHPFRRGLLVVVVYVSVALALVLAQFSRNTGFTFNVGSIAVSGKYERESGEALGRTARALSGPLGLFFGGMEFRMAESDGLASVRDGRAHPIRPSSIAQIEGGIRVEFSDGSELRFVALFVGGEETLRASAVLPRGISELRIPYRPMRSSRVTDLGNGRSAVVFGGDSFAFAESSVDGEKRVVALKASAPSFAYGKIVPKKGFTPADFISPQAADGLAYEGARARWVDQAFAAWERAMAAEPDEETVVAYTAEAARRGNYRGAVATAPKSFVDGSARGFRSAPYYGRLDEGLRSLLSAERETLGRLSRLANERNVELFSEPDLIPYISIRASKTLVDDIAAFARTLDPGATTPALAVGYIECWTDWSLLRADQANPFEKLMDQSRFVLSGMLRKAGDGSAFLVSGDRADFAFSLRAGRALIRAGAVSKDRSWADIGRTIILSALALSDSGGALPSAASIPEGAAAPSVPAGGLRLSAARAFRFLAPETLLPRAAPLLSDGGTLLWAWTAAPASATRTSESIDIASVFPVGETHYMIIRGVRPFTKIQLYGIDFRTDPRFERYDSSGWAYSASEQTLLVKMKHRATTELIRIFY